MDGMGERSIICEDGCGEREKSNVQFLFLFNDRVAGIIGRQSSLSKKSKVKIKKSLFLFLNFYFLLKRN